MKVFLIFGPPGAGKGTQGEQLAKESVVKHLSTGEVLRNNISQGTSLGVEAKAYMDKGELVPDELLNRMVEDYFASYNKDLPLLLDGYPRTIPQGNFLLDLLKRRDSFPFEVINISIGEDELVKRLLGRGRADDSEFTIKNRIKVYHEQTSPLLEFFHQLVGQGQAKIHEINGAREINQVYQDVKAIF